jgi:hypothetical protein
MRLCTICAVLFYSPFTIYMPRVALLAALQPFFPSLIAPAPDHSNRRTRRVFHALLTTALLAMNLAVALTVTNLGAVFGFIGAISGIAIALVMPSAFMPLLSLDVRTAPTHCVTPCVVPSE